MEDLTICDICQKGFIVIGSMEYDDYCFIFAKSESNYRIIDQQGHSTILQLPLYSACPITTDESEEQSELELEWIKEVDCLEKLFVFDLQTAWRFYNACITIGYDRKEHGSNIELWFLGYLSKL